MKKINFNFIFVIIILSTLYLFPRLYKFTQKTTYHLDQGLHLLESYRLYNDKKISLIGPMVSSKTFQGRGFFIGSQYYYIIGILGILFNWNPISISIFLLLFEFIFILAFCYWIYRKKGYSLAFILFLFLATNKYLIIHSRFIWNPHFLLPLSIIAIFSIDKYFLKQKQTYFYLFFLFWGLAFSFHYSSVFWLIPAFYLFYLAYKNKHYLALFIWPIFVILGNLPIFLFELKHQFYNIKTIIFVFLNSDTSGKLELHYLIQPISIFLITFLLIKFNKKLHLFLFFLLLNLLSFFYYQPYIPLGHPPYWHYSDAQKVTTIILSHHCMANYNIASTVSGDTRSYDIRFLLTKENCPPLSVDQYSQAQNLFLIAPKHRPPQTETVWEVDSLRPFAVVNTYHINQYIDLYLLQRQVLD